MQLCTGRSINNTTIICTEEYSSSLSHVQRGQRLINGENGSISFVLLLLHIIMTLIVSLSIAFESLFQARVEINIIIMVII